MTRRLWRCTGVRLRHVRGPYQALAASIVLQGLWEWETLQRNEHGGPPWPLAGERGELQEFFASEWCRDLCDWGGWTTSPFCA